VKKTLRKLLGIFSIALVLCFPVVSFANSDKAAMHLQKALSNLSQMQASFYQRVIGSELSVIDEGSGKFYLSRPGKFRWDYFAEDGKTLVDQIISDGSDIYFYNLRSLQKAMLQVPSLVLVSGTVDLKKIFHVTELPESLGLNWFLLKPIVNSDGSADPGYDELRLGFSKGQLIAFNFVNSIGQTTQLQFDNIVSGVANAVFKFKVPEGADVTRDQ